jgi:hypothetical protein
MGISVSQRVNRVVYGLQQRSGLWCLVSDSRPVLSLKQTADRYAFLALAIKVRTG